MNNFLDAEAADGTRSFVDPNTPNDADQCRPEAGEGDVSVCRQCCDPELDGSSCCT